jgi:hypothetical protein
MRTTTQRSGAPNPPMRFPFDLPLSLFRFHVLRGFWQGRKKRRVWNPRNVEGRASEVRTDDLSHISRFSAQARRLCHIPGGLGPPLPPVRLRMGVLDSACGSEQTTFGAARGLYSANRER